MSICHLKTSDGIKTNKTYWTQHSGNMTSCSRKGDGIERVWKIHNNTVWRNEIGEISSFSIQHEPTIKHCQKACEMESKCSNKPTDCVGFTFQGKSLKGQCYLKSRRDARFLEQVPIEKQSAVIKGKKSKDIDIVCPYFRPPALTAI